MDRLPHGQPVFLSVRMVCRAKEDHLSACMASRVKEEHEHIPDPIDTPGRLRRAG